MDKSDKNPITIIIDIPESRQEPGKRFEEALRMSLGLTLSGAEINVILTENGSRCLSHLKNNIERKKNIDMNIEYLEKMKANLFKYTNGLKCNDEFIEIESNKLIDTIIRSGRVIVFTDKTLSSIV